MHFFKSADIWISDDFLVQLMGEGDQSQKNLYIHANASREKEFVWEKAWNRSRNSKPF